ncbi:MAG: transporter component [Actinomycetota bacterium]|nr:transporter component [Actinomycetota bacterium]
MSTADLTVSWTPSRPGALHRRSALVLAAVSAVGVIAFFWPFLAEPGSAILGHSRDAPWLFALILPLLLALVLAELAEGGLDSRGIAMLGVLSAVAAVLRPFGAGTVGFEPIWVVIILGGRALGPGFGFVLGNVSLFASAMLTGGVGPWLPFQMIAAGWIGFGAGLLPSVRPRIEPVLLMVYGAVVSVGYGFLLNLWFWPWLAPSNSAVAFVPGASVAENLHHWLLFNLATSLGYDLPRAIVVGGLLLLTARPVLGALRRATRKAAFDQPIVFEEAPA